jgi:hypothetical protein
MRCRRFDLSAIDGDDVSAAAADRNAVAAAAASAAVLAAAAAQALPPAAADQPAHNRLRTRNEAGTEQYRKGTAKIVGLDALQDLRQKPVVLKSGCSALEPLQRARPVHRPGFAIFGSSFERLSRSWRPLRCPSCPARLAGE